MEIRPLDGMSVLDLTHVLAGPYCSYQLGLLGADVIKVEPHTGDLVRPWMGTQEQVMAGMGTGFMAQNAGKRSLCVDITKPAGRDLILELAESADIFLENYRPGALERHGLGFDAVRAVNSKIVYTSISAFGQTGPFANRPGFDDVIQGTSGFMASNKREQGPIRTGGPVLDYATGMHSTSAILGALMLRDRTGEPQRVDVAMQDVTMLLLNYETAEASQNGGIAPLKTDLSAPMLGRFASSDGYVMLAGYLPRHCQSLAKALRIPELESIEFMDLFTRGSEIEAIVAARILEKTTAEWDQIFAEAEVVGGGVAELSEAFATGQPQAREITSPLDTPVGEIHATSNGYRTNDVVWGPRSSVPRLGEHSREILTELGRDEAAITALMVDDVVREPGSHTLLE